MIEKKEKFDEEMAEKGLFWEKKLEALELEYTDKKHQLEKRQKREDEEYQYQLEVSRRKDTDTYQAKKQAMEKELEMREANLETREANLKAQESILNELQEKVANFPNELNRVTVETEERIRGELEADYKHASDLCEKEFEGIKQLQLQKITHLEAKIKEQDEVIKELTKKADSATHQVHAIACPALDTSAQRFYPMNQDEKALEKQRAS